MDKGLNKNTITICLRYEKITAKNSNCYTQKIISPVERTGNVKDTPTLLIRLGVVLRSAVRMLEYDPCRFSYSNSFWF